MSSSASQCDFALVRNRAGGDEVEGREPLRRVRPGDGRRAGGGEGNLRVGDARGGSERVSGAVTLHVTRARECIRDGFDEAPSQSAERILVVELEAHERLGLEKVIVGNHLVVVRGVQGANLGRGEEVPAAFEWGEDHGLDPASRATRRAHGGAHSHGNSAPSRRIRRRITTRSSRIGRGAARRVGSSRARGGAFRGTRTCRRRRARTRAQPREARAYARVARAPE